MIDSGLLQSKKFIYFWDTRQSLTCNPFLKQKQKANHNTNETKYVLPFHKWEMNKGPQWEKAKQGRKREKDLTKYLLPVKNTERVVENGIYKYQLRPHNMLKKKEMSITISSSFSVIFFLKKKYLSLKLAKSTKVVPG